MRASIEITIILIITAIACYLFQGPSVIIIVPLSIYICIKRYSWLKYTGIIKEADYYFNNGFYSKAKELYNDASDIKAKAKYPQRQIEVLKKKIHDENIKNYGEGITRAYEKRRIEIGMNRAMVEEILGNPVEVKPDFIYYESREYGYKRLKVSYDKNSLVTTSKELKT